MAFAQKVSADPPAAPAPAQESRYLERIESPVYDAEGDHQAITKRAVTCIAQTIKPGFTTAPTIISSDVESGVIVANSSFQYTWGLFGMIQETARTKLTFQAKDSRFRIVNTDIEEMYSGPQNAGISVNWQPVGTWKSASQEASALTASAQTISDKLAACVKAKAAAGDDW
jgi:hypothetical protein